MGQYAFLSALFYSFTTASPAPSGIHEVTNNSSSLDFDQKPTVGPLLGLCYGCSSNNASILSCSLSISGSESDFIEHWFVQAGPLSGRRKVNIYVPSMVTRTNGQEYKREPLHSLISSSLFHLSITLKAWLSSHCSLPPISPIFTSIFTSSLHYASECESLRSTRPPPRGVLQKAGQGPIR